MPLSDTAIKNAKPALDKAYKLADEKGSIYWFIPMAVNTLDYRFIGKRKTLALGTYPETSLKSAREKRDDARAMMANGINPSENSVVGWVSLRSTHPTNLPILRVVAFARTASGVKLPA